MADTPDSAPVEITLRRSGRARRFSLRVSRLDGRVTLTMPSRASEREAWDFARRQEDWIRAALAKMPSRRLVGFGATIPVEGAWVELAQGKARAPRFDGARLELPGAPAQAGARARSFLKTLARERLVAACDRHAAEIGRPYSSVALRDTRSRWGSCSADGRLMFSWRLIMAPPAVLDYVAAHEVAHLAEMNHSPAFWAVVARLCPAYAKPRAWLRSEGQDLHGWVFAACDTAGD